MKVDELEKHPAYQALTPTEQREIDERLQTWHLDAAAVAATTGAVFELEASDLRFWLSSTRERPWAMISLCAQPKQADELLSALLDRVPGLANDRGRAQLVDLARDLSRVLVVAEGARFDQGFVRDEQLAALWREVDELAAREPAWHEEAVLDTLTKVGLAALADALIVYRRETTGVRGVFHRLRERARTTAFDLAHGGLYIVTGSSGHEGHYDPRKGVWSNWTKGYSCQPARYERPHTEEELARVVAGASKVRVVGGGHTFNDSPLTSDTMISLDDYDRVLSIDREHKRARVQGGIRLRDLNKALASHGLGLPVLGSTDTQTLAGLVATDLHGTGRDVGFLSEQLISLRVMDQRGNARTVGEGEPLFHAAIGALGTCGVLTEVELQLVDAFNLAKVTEMVDRSEAEARIDELLADNEHLSFYYVGGANDNESVRIHRWNRTDEPPSEHWERKKTRTELTDFAISGFAPDLAELLVDIDEDGPVSDALAPDKRLVMPGSRGFGRRLFYRHDEIEFGVPFERHQACLAEILELLRERDFFSIIELRFTPDHSKAMLGPGVGRPSAYIELATPLSQHHEEVYAEVEEILRAHGGQPHLGKKTNMSAQDMLETYGERYVEFQKVRAAQDPEGKFLNPFTTRIFGA